MARLRNTAGSSGGSISTTGSSVARSSVASSSTGGSVAPGKRKPSNGLPSPATTMTSTFREGSPGKNVHFGRRLEQGPTQSGPGHRSASPVRPAIFSREEQPRTRSRSPSVQLREEQDDAEALYSPDESAPSPRKKSKNGKSSSAAADNIYNGISHEQRDDQRDDERICREMKDLIENIKFFAWEVTKEPDIPLHHSSTSHLRNSYVLEDMFKADTDHLVRYIGCIAQGGRNHVTGWRDLLDYRASRKALILGIVGRVLKEHVLSVPYFGASEELQKALDEMEKNQINDDGFARTRSRAELIEEDARNSFKRNEVALRTAIARLTLQLEKLLVPLLRLDTPPSLGFTNHKATFRDIIAAAADLNRRMRVKGDVVYHWTSTFKDEEFDPSHMECLNLAEMIEHSPYEKKTVDGFERATLRDADDEARKQAVVQVVCFPGLVAYRQYGGDLAKMELGLEKDQNRHLPKDVADSYDRYGKKLTGYEGYRTRTICKSIVHLEWSKQRLLTQEAGTSTHIDAMRDGGKKMERYTNDSRAYVALSDIYEECKKKGGRSLDEQEAAYGNRKVWW